MMTILQQKIEQILNNFDSYPLADIKISVMDVLKEIESGNLRVCEKKDNKWHVNQWVKQAILLFFKISPSVKMGNCFDKVPLKTDLWTEDDFKNAKFRMVPGSIVRMGNYIAPSVVVMPSFINIGAYIDEGTMVDSLVTVGSCAQIGKGVHLSSNVVIGGVLEPLQATPTIIEDHAFIGAGSSILEGMIIEEGAVIASGVTLTSATKIIDRETGNITYGTVPSYSVVIPGSYKISETLSTQCAIIIKKVDAKTRQKTAINDLLRL
jgi:2,3,4,5-tetrahydropyridine-2-carboxylate N-succinyltransferase